MRTLRHKNITALQEVVDDPSGNKVGGFGALQTLAWSWVKERRVKQVQQPGTCQAARGSSEDPCLCATSPAATSIAACRLARQKQAASEAAWKSAHKQLRAQMLLVMDYMEGGPVMTREALERGRCIPEPLALQYFRDMCKVCTPPGTRSPAALPCTCTPQVQVSMPGTAHRHGG